MPATILTLFRTVLRKLTPAEVDANFEAVAAAADGASAAAAAVVATADAAQTAANQAQTTASAAQTTASAAQTTANNALAAVNGVNMSNVVTREKGTWNPTLRGSGTAGTYEFTASECNYVADRHPDGSGTCRLYGVITMAAVVTGGGTGNLTIGGLPFPRSTAAKTSDIGLVQLSNIVFNGNPIASFGSSTTAIYIFQNASGVAAGALGIDKAVANTLIAFRIEYLI